MLEGKKCSKTFFKVLERENLQNQTIFESYTDDNKSKYSSNPKEILEFAKKIMKNFTAPEAATWDVLKKSVLKNFVNNFFIQRLLTTVSDIKQTSTVATIEFFSKITKNTNRKKISNGHFNLYEAEISLDKIIKSINSETNNKSPGNASFTAEFYKHYSNELVPVLLDVYESWGKLGTMVLLLEQEPYPSNTKKGMKKILQTTDPYATILKNRLQKTFRYYNRWTSVRSY